MTTRFSSGYFVCFHHLQNSVRPSLGFGEGALDETHARAAKEGKEALQEAVGSHTAPAGHWYIMGRDSPLPGSRLILDSTNRLRFVLTSKCLDDIHQVGQSSDRLFLFAKDLDLIILGV